MMTPLLFDSKKNNEEQKPSCLEVNIAIDTEEKAMASHQVANETHSELEKLLTQLKAVQDGTEILQNIPFNAKMQQERNSQIICSLIFFLISSGVLIHGAISFDPKSSPKNTVNTVYLGEAIVGAIITLFTLTAFLSNFSYAGKSDITMKLKCNELDQQVKDQLNELAINALIDIRDEMSLGDISSAFKERQSEILHSTVYREYIINQKKAAKHLKMATDSLHNETMVSKHNFFKPSFSFYPNLMKTTDNTSDKMESKSFKK